MKNESLTKEIEWFCHHAVTEHLLSRDDCVSVIEAIEENGLKVNLDLFVHVVLDNGICKDKARLDKLKASSKDEARVFGMPARSVFAKDNMAPIAPKLAPAAQQAQADSAKAETAMPKPQVASTKTADDPPASSPAKNVEPLKPLPDDGKATVPPPVPPPLPPKPAPDPIPLKSNAASIPQPTKTPANTTETSRTVVASVPPPLPPTQPKAPRNDPEWLKGWPRLADADGMNLDGARKLLNDFLHKARENNCSDIHLSAGARPFVRRYKQVFLLEDQDVLTQSAAEKLNLSPLDEDQRMQFSEHRDLDYGYTISENDRYRTNVMMQRLGIAGSYRVIDTDIRPIRDLGFKYPEVIEKLSTYGQGLILVTGPAGSGKSTTLTALVDHINRTRHDHIITVEDPIEVIHEPQGCNITQRELNRHTRSFGNALRAALREDPDVIVIGEMRDLETIEMAIHSSETGHLVIGTLHTSSAADTMNRILDVFPYGQQAQIRAMVAESLKGVICQQLLTNADGTGVVLATEVLLGTLAVSNLIREGKTYQLESTIQTNKNLGMITMEQSHFELFMEGKRTYEQTLPFVKSKDLLRQMQIAEAAKLGGGSQNAQTAQTAKKGGWF